MIPLSVFGFIDIRLLDILDILLVALLLFELYNFLKGTAAINIFIGLLAIFLIWKLVNALEMELLSDILGAFISVGFIALIVVFQPEIRRFLLLLGTPNFIRKSKGKFLFWRLSFNEVDNLDVDKIVNACREMSQIRCGALIVLAKMNELQQYVETGILLEAAMSKELLENIFYKNNPLHDGAVIILRNRIKAARCVLPITKDTDFPSDYGLRHRAGVGITEASDAVSVIVSEQTGKIAYSSSGLLTTDITASQLKDFLEEEFN
ncbi:MAG: diadenylate cyclase CdaA [Bacteroidales bacterium]|nr:diadenylate cyclase CdaA [Bacteroidales bacterium]